MYENLYLIMHPRYEDKPLYQFLIAQLFDVFTLIIQMYPREVIAEMIKGVEVISVQPGDKDK
jgi:hypothetical protein